MIVFLLLLLLFFFGMLANISYVLPSFSHLVSLNICEIYLVTNKTETWWNDLVGKGLLFFCDKGVCDDRWLECTLDIQKSPSLEEKNLKKHEKNNRNL